MGQLGPEEGCNDELEVYGDIPMARFGHTITLVCSQKVLVVLFGGATGDTGKYIMTGDTFLFNILTKIWTKLNSKPSHGSQGSSTKPSSSARVDER